MDATEPSSATAGCQHDLWRKIELSLAAIQAHCNQLLTHYPQLSSPQVVALIEAIEIHNFLLQELLAQLALSFPLADEDEDQE